MPCRSHRYVEFRRYLLIGGPVHPYPPEDGTSPRRQFRQCTLDRFELGTRFGDPQRIGRVVWYVDQRLDFGRRQVTPFGAQPIIGDIDRHAQQIGFGISDIVEIFRSLKTNIGILQRLAGKVRRAQAPCKPALQVRIG